MKTVKVTAGYSFGKQVDETVVSLIEASNDVHEVLLNNKIIGYVWKGTRRYSPPTHKGSRIARYHKLVPEWHGGPHKGSARYRRDTRQEVLRDLVRAYLNP